MGKNWLKGLKKPKKADPRPKQDINNEYTQLCVKVGNIKYNIAVLESQVSQLMSKMQDLNLEGAARDQLDAAKQQATTEVENAKA
jgi:hypothetical protein